MSIIVIHGIIMPLEIAIGLKLNTNKARPATKEEIELRKQIQEKWR